MSVYENIAQKRAKKQNTLGVRANSDSALHCLISSILSSEFLNIDAVKCKSGKLFPTTPRAWWDAMDSSHRMIGNFHMAIDKYWLF